MLDILWFKTKKIIITFKKNLSEERQISLQNENSNSLAVWLFPSSENELYHNKT